ncbi:hypothetical protein P9J64_05025 [Deltaproteobacteria bacterium IMCC39524]|nr:hypothetical protein [Deltaproteobacteria bacterium IMCC39524]
MVHGFHSKAKKTFGGVQNFLNTAVWILKEGLEGRKRAFFWVFTANFLGVGTVAASFAVLIGYARYQISGKEFAFRGYSVPVPDGLEGLLFYGGAALVLGVLSAYCVFWSQKGVYTLSAAFHKEAMVRAVSVVDFATRRTDLSSRIKFLAPQHDHRHVATVYTNYLAVSLKLLMEAIQPILIFLVSLALLIKLYFLATLSIVPVALIYMALVYLISKKSTVIQGAYVTGFSSLNRELTKTYELLMGNGNPNYDKATIGKIIDASNVDSVLSLFYERMLVAQRSNYVSQIFITISMVWLFLLFGSTIESNPESWTSILVFLIALRYSGASLRKVVTIAVGVSRFYPTVRVYHEFVCETERQSVMDSLHEEKPKLLSVNDKSSLFIDGSMPQLELVVGQPAYLLHLTGARITPVSPEIKRFLIENINQGGAGLGSNIYFHGSSDFVSTLTLLENSIGLNQGKDAVDELWQLLEEFRDVLDLERIKENLNEFIDDSLVDKIGKEALFLMLSAYVFIYKKEIVVIDYALFSSFEQPFIHKYLTLLAGYKIIFTANTFPVLNKIKIYNDDSRFIVGCDLDVIGIGDYQFLRDRVDLFNDIITGLKSDKSAAAIVLEDDEDLLL